MSHRVVRALMPTDHDYSRRAPSETRLVLLGTSGGPAWWHGTHRKGVSSAVVVGDATYLIDCGEGWGHQYRHAGLGSPGYQGGIEDLRAVFITHQHSDHTVDYPNLLTFAWNNGGPDLKAPIQVFGPGDRGELPPIHGTPEADLPVVCPGNPTPGMVGVTDALVQAFATDFNDRMRDNHTRDLAEVFQVHDIPLPAGTGDSPNSDPSPDMDPFVVWEDDRVRVSAVLVNHAPVFPAFGFRFDTDDASIVFSGDTCPCDNLVRLAEGADILVHEVIDREWAEAVCVDARDQALLHHLLSAHTTIEQVGPVAQRAGVSALVLNHLVPGNNDEARWERAQAGYDGQLIVGQDLMHIAFE